MTSPPPPQTQPHQDYVGSHRPCFDPLAVLPVPSCGAPQKIGARLRTRSPGAFVLCLLLFEQAALPDQPAPRNVSADLRTLVVQSGVPGLIGAIVDKDGLVAIGAAGVRRMGSPMMLTANDQVHIGSCTKAMTATVIAMLVEENKLTWNASVVSAFPDLRGDIDRGWNNATLTDLLTHSSGAPTDLHFNGLWGRLWSSKAPPPEQRMMLVRGVLTRPPNAPPGTKYIYSNAGYAIAGVMAERAAGTDWENLMRQRLFTPLGMDSAGFGAPGISETVDQPRGHTEAGKVIEPGPHSDNPSAIAPAGTVHCTVEDWSKFIRLHLNAEMGVPHLLTAESFRTLHTAANRLTPEYAMGWGIVNREWAGGRTLTHNGSNTLWFCAVWIAPLKGFAVMAACNQGGKTAEKTVDQAVWMLVQQQLGAKR